MSDETDDRRSRFSPENTTRASKWVILVAGVGMAVSVALSDTTQTPGSHPPGGDTTISQPIGGGEEGPIAKPMPEDDDEEEDDGPELTCELHIRKIAADNGSPHYEQIEMTGSILPFFQRIGLSHYRIDLPAAGDVAAFARERHFIVCMEVEGVTELRWLSDKPPEVRD